MSQTEEKKLRVAIVDDEELARAILRESLAEIEDMEIVAECGNGFEAVKAVAELKPDVLFLDIQMPKLNGFEVLELLGSDAPAVVFVTAYDQYALKAFEVHAVDYLLKPYGEDRFADALRHLRERLIEPTTPARADELAASARPEGEYAQRIVLRDGANVHIIPVDKLDYAEAQDDYVALAVGGKKLLKPQSMSSLEQSLDPRRFVRIHRSYLMNLERLKQIEPYGKETHVAILQSGERLPISRSGLQRLKEILDAAR